MKNSSLKSGLADRIRFTLYIYMVILLDDVRWTFITFQEKHKSVEKKVNQFEPEESVTFHQNFNKKGFNYQFYFTIKK